jgi:hypothetical protein
MRIKEKKATTRGEEEKGTECGAQGRERQARSISLDC